MFLKAKPESPAFFVGRYFFTLQVLSQELVRDSEYVTIAGKYRESLKNCAFIKKRKIIWEISYCMKWLGALCVYVQGMTFTSTLPCPSWHLVEAFAKPKLKGIAEDLFVFYKTKKQFFKDFFKLQFSSEVNSDETWKVFQEDLIQDFYAILRYMKQTGEVSVPWKGSWNSFKLYGVTPNPAVLCRSGKVPAGSQVPHSAHRRQAGQTLRQGPDPTKSA